ncbi:MAG: hypothetical protein WBA17_16140 [Saprospiraceae bacterium]
MNDTDKIVRPPQGLSARTVTIVAGVLLCYFMIGAAYNLLKMEFVLFGVLWELLTIPALGALGGITIYSLIRLSKQPNAGGRAFIMPLLIAVVTIALLIGSMFFG